MELARESNQLARLSGGLDFAFYKIRGPLQLGVAHVIFSQGIV